MALTFSTTSGDSEDRGVKVLVHAPAGYGKTVLCGTLPEPIILSAEAGLLSLRPENQVRLFGASREIPVIVIKSIKDLEEAFKFITESRDAAHFQSVALDSVTEMGEVALAAMKRQFKDGRQAYGEYNERMTACIRAFRDIPNKHVYFAAKQTRMPGETDELTRFGPMMPSKALQENLPHFFDEVFAMCISPRQADGSTYRYLRTQPDLNFFAKDRSGSLDEIEQPNLTSVINKIKPTQT